MNIRNKKNIGILLAAIMVASVFAVVVPSGIADDMEARASMGIKVTPEDDTGGQSTSYWVNFTLDQTIYNCTNITIAEAHRVTEADRPFFNFSTAALNTTLTESTPLNSLEYNGYDSSHNGIVIHVNSTTGNISGNVNISLDSVRSGAAGTHQFVVTIWNATKEYSSPIKEEVSGWFKLYAKLISPAVGQCIGGTFNFTWVDHPYNCDWKLRLIKKDTGEQKYYDKLADLHAVVDTTDFEDGCQNYTVKLCPEHPGCVPDFTDIMDIKIDNVKPCINCVSTDDMYGVNSIWYNGTAPITLNVSACDVCCGIQNITANISAVSSEGIVKFKGPFGSAGAMCTGAIEACVGEYYTHEILTTYIGPSDITNITVKARDNATTINNTNTCKLRFGVDKRDPEKVDDVVCDNTEAGAITVQWDEGEDLPQPPNPSGIKEYIIYYRQINRATNETVEEGVLTTTTSTSYLFNPATAHGIAKYCFNYTFKVKAVDNAGNVGVYSDPTDQQHLKPGIPDQVDITHPLEGGVVIACTNKTGDYIKATIKDQFGVPVGGKNYEVHIAATKGVVCPWKIAPIPDEGNVTSAYKAPQWVPNCEPVAINVSLWNSTDGTYINSSIVNIEICPKQADDIELTANPEMIMAGAGAVNKSTITVQLIDENDYAVHLTGVDIVVTTNAGTFENGEQEISGYTNEIGTFTATLTSSKTPTLATVTADANSHWWIKTVDVTFAGYGSYDIPLCAGWNLISLPLVPQPTNDAGLVLSGIAGELVYACAYNAFTGNWSFGRFDVPGTWGPIPGYDFLDTMRVQEGYWLYMNESAKLNVTGYTVIPPPFNLPPTFWVNAGWNLVGYYVVPPDKVTTAENYFGDVIVRYNMLGYDCESQGYFAVGAGDNLRSGKGYWMNAKTIGEITPKEWL